MVTLINGGTASASEILAGALQDNSRSELLGSTSFGKGEIQTLVPLGDGSGLAVTVARYLTPNGRPIQGLGLEPDQPLEGPEPSGSTIGSDEDNWLRTAVVRLERQVTT
jgi:carboxyl-terminal processing protease